MAQIRSKQIADFLSTVEWASVTNSQNASDIKSYVDAAISLEHTHHTDEAASLEALISSANNDLSSVDARILAEEGRVDAILLAADADKDSFAEIVSLINAVDTVNDDALAVVIGNLNSEIASTNADVTSIDARMTAEELALSNEIAATNGDVSSLNAALAAEIAATNADVTSLATDDAGLDARLVTLEGTIMEDNEQSVEVFAGAGLSYSVTNPVQDDNKNLVDVYVNGQRVLVGSVSGTAIELLSPGYVIDAADQVIVVYQY